MNTKSTINKSLILLLIISMYFSTISQFSFQKVSASTDNFASQVYSKTVNMGEEVTLTPNDLQHKEDYSCLYFDSIPNSDSQLGIGSAINSVQPGFVYSKSMLDNGDVTIKFKSDKAGIYSFQVSWQSYCSLSGEKTSPSTGPITITILVVNVDNAPSTGNNGNITISNINTSGLTLNWTKATDDKTVQSDLEYQIYQSTTNNIDTVRNIESSGISPLYVSKNIETFNVTGLSPDTAYFFNILVKDATGNKSVYQIVQVRTKSLTYAAIPIINTQPTDQTVIVGFPATLSVAASGGETLSYQWYSNTTNSATGGTLIPGATSAIYMPSTGTAGKTYYYVVITNTDRSATGQQIATVTSRVANVQVNALTHAAVPSIVSQPTNQTVNVGDSATLSVEASGGVLLSYQWYSNTTNSATGGTLIPGATSAIYMPPTGTAGTTYYYVVITNTDRSATGQQTATVTSRAADVQVNALTHAAVPSIVSQPTNQTVNVGDSATLSVEASGGETISYQWYSNTMNSTTGGTLIPGATSAIYSPPTGIAETTYYYVVIMNTDRSATGQQTATATSRAAKVQVNALTHAAIPRIDTQPTDQTVDVGIPATLSVAASGGETLSYQWYSNTTNSTTSGSMIPGATSATYTPPTGTEGTKYYYVVITNTDRSATGQQTAIATSHVAKVRVTQPTLSLYNVNFDKKIEEQADLEVNIILNGSSLNSIQNNNEILIEGEDYTVTSGDTVIINKEYLEKQNDGTASLVFNFNPTYSLTLTVTISNTTAQPPAPNVTANDSTNKLIGADSTMEYSTDNGATWKDYDNPTFNGNVSVLVRVKVNGHTPAGLNTEVNFKTNLEIPSQPTTEQVVVDVEGNDGSNLTKISITRSTGLEGIIKDKVVMTESLAKETVLKAKKQGVSTARIVIPDTEDKVSEVLVEVPKVALDELNKGSIKLEIVTTNAVISIPSTSINNFNQDLYFRIVPIKSESEKKQLEDRAKKETLNQKYGNNTVQVLGLPMEIETNMQSRQVSIVLPLKASLPTNPTERQKILSSLGVYIEHSDGSKELIKGKVIEMQDGTVGLEFGVNKFSKFTIVYLEGWNGEELTSAHKPYVIGNGKEFQPNAPVTRAQMAIMLSRNLNGTPAKNGFNDIPSTHWAYAAVMKVKGV
ncbi:MAG TPA: DUF4073 domain-containing protein, partial [Ureibacillus sp.]|nr:DUF4073 domain-containing protein [Ureibacillus sp.]